jgi:cell division protein FtsA
MSGSYGERSEIIGLVDLGTSKVTCLIAERAWPAGHYAAPAVRVMGVGHQRSAGIKAGMVIDLDAAGDGVRAAVANAERAADVTLDDVVVTVSCGRLQSAHMTTRVDLDFGYVRAEDLARLASAARDYAMRDDCALVHLNRVAYSLDGETGVREPIRLAGSRLSANWHAVTADTRPLENLSQVIDRAHLGIRQFLPSGLAAALTATTPDERRLGVTCINFGAGVIDIARFLDGQFLFTETLPVGGVHLTYDIAKKLSTPLAEAERIKTLYGTLVAARSDEHELVQYALAGELEGEAYQTSRAEIARILLPRTSSQLRNLKERLDKADKVVDVGPNVVLTGGASQLVGLADLTARIVSRNVRVGNPPMLTGLPQSMRSPAFSAVAGLALAAPPAARQALAAHATRTSTGSYLDRMERWLRESF